MSGTKRKDYIGCFDATGCHEPVKLCPAQTKSKQVDVLSDEVLSVVNTRYQKSLKQLGAIKVQGCEKEDQVSRFYNRTAGILAMVLPCGIIVSHCDMYTSKSCAQVFAWILRECSSN